MTQLRNCPGCQRHVRVNETACPFCAAELEASAPPKRTGSAATRAAIFAGAALLAPAACGDKTPEPKNPDIVEQSVDAAPIDDGVDKDGELTDEERAEKERLERERLERERELQTEPDRDLAKPYGAPPNRERNA